MFISTKVKVIIGLKCAVFLQDKTELISLIPDKSGNPFCRCSVQKIGTDSGIKLKKKTLNIKNNIIKNGAN